MLEFLPRNRRLPREWPSIVALRQLSFERALGGEDPRIAGAFQVVTEDVVAAIRAADADRLLAGHDGLRDLLSTAVAAAGKPSNSYVEAEPAFGIGRLAG